MSRRYIRLTALVLCTVFSLTLAGCASSEKAMNYPQPAYAATESAAPAPAGPAYASDEYVPTLSEAIESAFIRGETYMLEDGETELYGMGAEQGLYTARDVASGLFGIYDLEAGEYVHAPEYDYIGDYGPYADGTAVAQKDGYCGYIGSRGEKLIGFMYEDAAPAVLGVFPVMTGGKWGAIDAAGNILVKTEHTGLFVDAYCNIIVGEDGTYRTLYKPDGTEFTYGLCKGYTVSGDVIYTEDDEGYDCNFRMYDFNGNILTSPGPLAVDHVTLPSGGVCIGQCSGERANRFGYSQKWSYQYIREDGTPLSDNIYGEATPFNELGYAIAEYTMDTWTSRFTLLDSEGTELRDLPFPNLGAASNHYVWANDYMAYAYGTSGLSPTQYALLKLSTDEFIPLYDEPEPIAYTNCILISDPDTGLYGLYDGDELVFDCLYNEITFDGKVFTGIRGAEEFTHTPIWPQ